MAAGTAYSWGRAVTPQRAQEAFLPLISSKPVGIKSYRHALKIICLCLAEKQEKSEKSQLWTQSVASRPLHPLHLAYNAFIAVLVLWAHALGLNNSQSSEQHQQRPENNIWVVYGGKLEPIDDTLPREKRGDAIESSDKDVLVDIIEREFSQTEPDIQKVDIIKADVCRLMQMVRNRLAESAWELCKLANQIVNVSNTYLHEPSP